MIDVVAFLQLTGRTRCEASAFEWIDEYGATLAQLATNHAESLDLQLTLCTLREEIPTDTLLLFLKFLSDPSFCSAPIGNVIEYAEQLSNELKKAADQKPYEIPPTPPRRTMGDAWRNLLERLLDLKPKAHRRAAMLLGLILPADLATRTATIAAQVEREESRLLKLLRQFYFDGTPRRMKRCDRKQLKQAATISGLDEELRQLIEYTDFALIHIPAIADNRSHSNHWIHLLSRLPTGECALRLSIFVRSEQARLEGYDPDGAQRRLHQLMTDLCRLFARRGFHPTLLARWHSDPITDLINRVELDGESRRRWIRLFEATVYDRNLPLGHCLLSSLEEFAVATADVDSAAQVVASLAESEDEYYDNNEIRAALALGSSDSQRAAILQKLCDDYDILHSALKPGWSGEYPDVACS